MKIRDLRKSAERLAEYLKDKEAEDILVKTFGPKEQPAKSFNLYKNQVEAYGRWRRKHKEVCTKGDMGAIGGGDKWIFMPTGVGMCIKYVCACGDGIDLTEVDKW